MSKCIVDATASPTFRRDVKTLNKTYRHVSEDLQRLFVAIAAEYDMACNATRLKMYGNADHLKGRVWKYDCKSSDLRRNPRECLRVIAILDENETTSQLPVMKPIWCDMRKNIPDFINAKDILRLVARLKQGDEDAADSAFA